MAVSLRTITIDALSWNLIGTVGPQIAKFITGIILARILFPEQFGLIGMLLFFTAVAGSFADSGFSAALIQKRATTRSDTNSIFFFNIVVGLIATGILYLLAPLIARFYNQPVLTNIVRGLCIIILIDSFGIIPATIYTKELNFKVQALVGMIAVTLSGICGVIMATFGYGVWSLVVQQVSSSLFRTVCLWLISPWRPSMTFSFAPLREMYGFGSRLLFSELLTRIFDNIYYVIIGKLFSAIDLGFFTRAKLFQEIPSGVLAGMVGRVIFPVFSSIQDEPPRLKKVLHKSLISLALLNFPVMIGLALVAKPLVLVLLTDKWSACVPYIQLLCVFGLLHPLHLINLNLLMALGRSDLFFRLELIKKVLIVISIAIMWRWGISALIYGMIAVSIIAYYLNSYYAGVLIRYSIREQLRDITPYFIASILMGLVVFIVGLLPLSNEWIILFLQIVTGLVAYIVICWAFRLEAIFELWRIASSKMLLIKKTNES